MNATIPPDQAGGPLPRLWPRWIAHRGAGKLAPENTLAAFALGRQHGYLAFECDVKASADGELYLLHDDTLDRTTTGRGPVAALSWPQLARLDAGSWHSAPYLGEPLPRLAELARWLHRESAWLDLEIKPCPGTEATTGQAVALAAAALWATPEQRSRLLLSSFSTEALQAAHQAAPELACGLLLDELRPGWQAQAEQPGCCAVITHHRWMDAALVQWLHQRGLAAMVYTVNDPAEAARLQSIGVDSLITDAVDRFAPAA